MIFLIYIYGIAMTMMGYLTTGNASLWFMGVGAVVIPMGFATDLICEAIKHAPRKD